MSPIPLLPTPHDGMTAERKGELLLRYAQTGTLVRHLDFSGVRLRQADLSGADLRDANLKGAVLLQVSLIGACLDGADLRGAALCFSHLEHSSFFSTQMQDAELSGALVSGAYFWNADLRNAVLDNLEGVPESRQGALLTAWTIKRCEWNAAQLRDWLNAGAKLSAEEYTKLPQVLQEALHRDNEGLTLYFNNRLLRQTRWLIELVNIALTDPLSDCKIAEFNTQHTPAWVRLTASRKEDLIWVAEAWYRMLWTDQEALDHLRRQAERRAVDLDEQLQHAQAEATALQKVVDDHTEQLQHDRSQLQMQVKTITMLAQMSSDLSALRSQMDCIEMDGESYEDATQTARARIAEAGGGMGKAINKAVDDLAGAFYTSAEERQAKKNAAAEARFAMKAEDLDAPAQLPSPMGEE